MISFEKYLFIISYYIIWLNSSNTDNKIIPKNAEFFCANLKKLEILQFSLKSHKTKNIYLIYQKNKVKLNVFFIYLLYMLIDLVTKCSVAKGGESNYS